MDLTQAKHIQHIFDAKINNENTRLNQKTT